MRRRAPAVSWFGGVSNDARAREANRHERLVTVAVERPLFARGAFMRARARDRRDVAGASAAAAAARDRDDDAVGIEATLRSLLAARGRARLHRRSTAEGERGHDEGRAPHGPTKSTRQRAGNPGPSAPQWVKKGA